MFPYRRYYENPSDPHLIRIITAVPPEEKGYLILQDNRAMFSKLLDENKIITGSELDDTVIDGIEDFEWGRMMDRMGSEYGNFKSDGDIDAFAMLHKNNLDSQKRAEAEAEHAHEHEHGDGCDCCGDHGDHDHGHEHSHENSQDQKK